MGVDTRADGSFFCLRVHLFVSGNASMIGTQTNVTGREMELSVVSRMRILDTNGRDYQIRPLMR